MWKCHKCQKPVYFGKFIDIFILLCQKSLEFTHLDLFNFQLNVNKVSVSIGTLNVFDVMNAVSAYSPVSMQTIKAIHIAMFHAMELYLVLNFLVMELVLNHIKVLDSQKQSQHQKLRMVLSFLAHT